MRQLLDLGPTNNLHFPSWIFDFMMRAKYSARRFYFTEETTQEIGKFVTDLTDIFLHNYQFALSPYPHCYLQYNQQAWLQAIGISPDASGDYNIGFINEEGLIATLIDGAMDKRVFVNPVLYTLDMPPHTPARRPPKSVYLKFDRETLKIGHILGKTFNDAENILTDEIISDLDMRVRHWVPIESAKIHLLNKPENIRQLISNCSGDIRTWWAHALWLNQARDRFLTIESVPHMRTLVKGRPVVYRAHHIVRLKPATTYHHIARAFFKRETPRRHEVRPFWRNFNKTECEHDFPYLPDDKDRFYCRKCPQWRIRVKDHLRGDAGKGFITKEYKA